MSIIYKESIMAKGQQRKNKEAKKPKKKLHPLSDALAPNRSSDRKGEILLPHRYFRLPQTTLPDLDDCRRADLVVRYIEICKGGAFEEKQHING
jgi:hypothetical protein